MCHVLHYALEQTNSHTFKLVAVKDVLVGECVEEGAWCAVEDVSCGYINDGGLHPDCEQDVFHENNWHQKEKASNKRDHVLSMQVDPCKSVVFGTVSLSYNSFE